MTRPSMTLAIADVKSARFRRGEKRCLRHKRMKELPVEKAKLVLDSVEVKARALLHDGEEPQGG